jgi:hypothetical protein
MADPVACSPSSITMTVFVNSLRAIFSNGSMDALPCPMGKALSLSLDNRLAVNGTKSCLGHDRRQF